jgi:hypothetical protein
MADIQTCKARATQRYILLGPEICLYVLKPLQKENTTTAAVMLIDNVRMEFHATGNSTQ